MSIKILGIQFRKNEQAIAQEQVGIRRELGEDVPVTFVSALDESVAWTEPESLLAGYTGVVLGGSGEFDFDGNRAENDPDRQVSYVFLERLKPLFGYIFANDIPTFGICYGHQILGAFAGARVAYDPTQKKTRSHEVRRLVDTDYSPLFFDVPERFAAHYGHKDALDQVPEGAVLLMDGGDGCKVSALQYKNNIYTTQFHPELTFADMVERINNSPGYLPEGVTAEEIFSDDPHSNKLLQNFGKVVVQCVETSTSARKSV